MSLAFLGRYPSMIDRIERQFRVTEWRSGDVDIWPLARLDLYLDMYWQEVGAAAPHPYPFALRAGARIVRPLSNRWKCRHDRAHYIARPQAADTVLLGDGVSLDCVDRIWRDRFGEPLIAALEKQGRTCLLMQSGDLSRLPWRRPTFPANLVEAKGWLGARARPVQLPDHAQVVDFLRQNGVAAPSLEQRVLARRAAIVSSTASAFEAVLRIVRPKLAFVVTHYANLGPAFTLACRRQAILSVDLQHAPLAGAPMAYGWSALPPQGYTTLPALFWNWSVADAARTGAGFEKLDRPWHRSLPGGHLQWSAFQDEQPFWDAKFRAVAGPVAFAREILVALQPVAGHRPDWDALAAEIEAAPPCWRWWIRRHPTSRPNQDAVFGRLLALRKANVMIDQASTLPLPALLPHMSALLSLASGAAEEAAKFSVPAFFLSTDATAPFADLIAQGRARVIDIGRIIAEVAGLPTRMHGALPEPQPRAHDILPRLDEMARDYAALCQAAKA